MKHLMNSKILPVFTAALGILGCALRLLLYTVAVDEKNLIPLWHPLEILLWLVTAAAAVLVLGLIRQLRNTHCDAGRFRPDFSGAAGSAVMAAGLFVTALLDGLALSGLDMVRDLLAIVSAGAMLAIALCRWKGKEPFFLLHAVVCVFFAVHMVGCYRSWSSNPQLMDYVFTLFASVGLMLFAFYHGCLESGMGKLRMLPGVGLLTTYCCIVALSGTDYTVLYLCGAVWCLTDLCRLHTGE